MRKKKTINREDVKGVVSKIVSQILTNKSLKLAPDLATEYIRHKKEGTPINSFVAKSSSIPQLAQSAAFAFLYKLWQETFKEMVARLSKNTSSALCLNYDTTIIQKIIDALIDFEVPIETQKSLEKILQCSADPKKVQEARLKLKATKTLLKGIGLSAPERQNIEEIYRKYKDILGKVRKIPMDIMKLTALYQAKNVIPETESISIAEYVSNFPKIEKAAIERQEWHRAWHSVLSKIIVNQGQGKPSQIFFNAIQIIIYRLLADESKPKTIRRHKAWCKRLTTNIINEAYKDLPAPMLTPNKLEKMMYRS